ncbi:Hypothetical predicted protein, partial [Pelobates cultripes]
KCKLIAEIKTNREVYSGDLAKAVENIMEKKSSLEARVTIAKTVLKSPSESTYCNLDQLVALLKENFEKERLVSDSLKSCCNVSRAQVNSLDSSTEQIFVKDHIEVSEYKNDKSGIPIEVEYDIDQNKQGHHEEKPTVHQEYNLSISHSTLAGVSQSFSDPDVIIEEIIFEDDKQACSDTNVVDVQKKRKGDTLQQTPHLDEGIYLLNHSYI